VSYANGLIHVCTIQRNTQAALDEYNKPEEPVWGDLTTLPCRLIPMISNVRGMGGLVGKGGSIGVVDTVKRVYLLLLPRETDVTEYDRVVNVKNRRGGTVETGPLSPLLVRTVSGWTEHHRSVILEKVT